MIETGSSDPLRPTGSDRIGRWPQQPRSLPWPLRVLVLIAFTVGVLAIFELAWPARDGVEWAEHLVTAVALVLGMAAGDAVATRRYGAGSLERPNPNRWRALGIFALTMFVVAVAILRLGKLVT